MNQQIEKSDEENKLTLAEFLEQTPPNQHKDVLTTFRQEVIRSSIPMSVKYITFPDIQLHCGSQHCSGIRFFRCTDNEEISLVEKKRIDSFLNYVCRNCEKNDKKFALSIYVKSIEPALLKVMKLGEVPFFGPVTPARVISLIGPDRETFLKGRRAENQGLGIGAFAYYRRVVENQKGRLIKEMGQAAKNLGASKEHLDNFEKASEETQFSRAIDNIKDAIPQSLLVNGHNPLSLLHSALSEGLHGKTDEDCLRLATSIRVVLGEMADRISQALKDEAELKQAVSNLLQVRDKT